MKKAGIVIDAWKAPFFEKRLTEAGYSFEMAGNIHDDKTKVLTVVTDDMPALGAVVKAANDEARRSRAQ